ncbi:MAG: right-handed parallel beta-helix repeat-containing protein, partial [Candidatus Kariarchaeaceae archaeon]
WNLIDSHLQEVYDYNWNLEGISESFKVMVKVIATCSEGLISEDISDGTFSVIPLIQHEPISIDSNEAFINQANNENWPGEGTDSSPYIISGYQISSTAPLIQIFNTDLFFRIQNCDLQGSNEGGIVLKEVLSGHIENTLIHDCGGLGIYVESSENVLISKNTIFNNGPDCGINLRGSSKCTINDNIVYDSTGWGIRVELGDGESESNIITGNIIYNNDGGIFIGGSNNFVSSNVIFDNSGNGIDLDSSSNDNFIFSNNISNNLNYGIQAGYSRSNKINWNNLIGNGLGNVPSDSPQIMNGEAINNEFSNNFFDDWTGSDANNDGIIDDDPYYLDGGGEDLHPLVFSHAYVSSPTVVFPNGGETLNETVVLQWTAAIDSHGHTMVYSLYYSSDNGLTWRIIVSDLTGVSYEWDTSNIGSSDTGLIKVITTCSEGLISEDISDSSFILGSEVDIPTILYPNGGEVVKGLITVRWEIATDSEGHSITYSLLYSSSKGQSWVSLASNLIATSYEWNTSTVQDGSKNMIKVKATCSVGFSAEDVSDSVFTIDNIPPPPNYFLFISFFAMLAVIPELYLGKKFSNFVNRKQIGISGIPEGVEN